MIKEPIVKNIEKIETEINRDICEHHKKYPKDTDYAGCTCSTSYVGKKKRAIMNLGDLKPIMTLGDREYPMARTFGE